jgi:serine/threonine protein kinase
LEYVGTLDYASPEILSQIPYDEKIDIWSLGCIAYELDVGRPPFFHINPE